MAASNSTSACQDPKCPISYAHREHDKRPMWERAAVIVGGAIALWVLLFAAIRWVASLYWETP